RQPVPVAALAPVTRLIAPAYEEALSAMPDWDEPPALVLGQYISSLDFMTAEREAALAGDMIALARARGVDSVVVQPHPVSDADLRRLTAAAAADGGAWLAEDQVPAEVRALRQRFALAVSCYSTALLILRELYGVPMAAVGTAEAMRRLEPFASSNRMPMVIVDALARPDPEALEGLPLNDLVALVAYAMQPVSFAHLRPVAVAAAAALPPAERQRYLGAATLTDRLALSSPDLPPLAVPNWPPGRGAVRGPAAAAASDAVLAEPADTAAGPGPDPAVAGDGPGAAGPPLFSVVSAVYNVAAYLPAFIAALERQSFPAGRVEIIMVDDGSTDDSAACLDGWQARRPGQVRVLREANQGQAAARNLGLEQATGEWVTFIDPDDFVADDYFERVAAFVAAQPDVLMVAANRVIVNEETGLTTAAHRLSGLFAKDLLVDLERWPNYFHNSAAAAFFRTAVLKDMGLRFDERVKPSFEDGVFCSRYLLRGPHPQVGFLASARYFYRKRLDQSSTLQTKRADPRSFTDMPRYGYLALLREADERYGRAPEWLKNLITYELTAIFREDISISVHGSVAPAVGRQFLDTAADIVGRLGEDWIWRCPTARLNQICREALVYGSRGRPHANPYAVIRSFDEQTGQLRFSLRYSGPRPEVVCYERGLPAAVVSEKVRAVRFFGVDLLGELIEVVTVRGTVRVLADGVPLELRVAEPSPPTVRLHPHSLPALLAGSAAPPPEPAAGAAEPSAVDPEAPVLLMDRVEAAGGNAEALFRHLRERRPEAPAWLVLSSRCPDWDRLHRDGFGDRLVAYGSKRWERLIGRARDLVLSDLTAAAIADRVPFPHGRPWRLTYLPPQVTLADVSRQVNAAAVDLMAAGVRAERAAIVADGSPYALTPADVVLTGLPRSDALWRLGAVAPAEADLVLLAPRLGAGPGR
ncbi:MAG: glycosyltransferase, partial [Propionibacteriaceae bacterium]|nr:glycosyltransferase [Propionibacteriaceae bacterium]